MKILLKNKKYKEVPNQISIEREEHKKELNDMFKNLMTLVGRNSKLEKDNKILKLQNEELRKEIKKLEYQKNIKEELNEKLNIWLEQNKLQIVNQYPEIEKTTNFDIMRNIEIVRYTMPQFDVAMMLEK